MFLSVTLLFPMIFAKKLKSAWDMRGTTLQDQDSIVAVSGTYVTLRAL